MDTKLFAFNENGLISSDALDDFVEDLQSHSRFEFKIFNKSDIDTNTTVFKKASLEGLEFIMYDHGYVMKLEGEIVNVIFLLKELDEIIPNDKEFFLSPIQAIRNTQENRYPRGADLQQIGRFLDGLFNNYDYSNALKNS